MTEYLCMTPEELALWQTRVDARAMVTSPCVDCPLWFSEEAKAQGRCSTDRTVSRISAKRLGQMREASRRWRRAQRTKAWKDRLQADVEAVRLARARATWDNDSAGTSSTSVDSLIDAVPLLVPGGAASSRHGQGLDA